MRLLISQICRPSFRAPRRSALAALGPAAFAFVLLSAPPAQAYDCACHSVKVMVIVCVSFAKNPKYITAEGLSSGAQDKLARLTRYKTGVIYKDKNGKYYKDRSSMPPDGTGSILYTWELSCRHEKAKGKHTASEVIINYSHMLTKVDFNNDGSIKRVNPAHCRVKTPSFETPHGGVKARAGNTNSRCVQYYKQVIEQLKAKGWKVRVHYSNHQVQ